MSDSHALIRTSPKGTPFIGKCAKCGIEGLSMSQVHDPCVNPAGLNNRESLELAIRIVAPGKGEAA